MNYDIESVGTMIAKAREKKGLSKRELSRIAGISDTELARIESGEREIPNPKTLRKISQCLDVNYNDLMYAAGLGIQVTPLNPFLKDYYAGLRGKQIDDALVNTMGSVENWQALVDSFKHKLEKDKNISEQEEEIMLQTIEDTEYQIHTANEIIKLLNSAKMNERRENDKRK